MKLLCELLTSDPEGGPARISFELFGDLYRYLAQIDGNVPLAHQEQILTYLSFDVCVCDLSSFPKVKFCFATGTSFL